MNIQKTVSPLKAGTNGNLEKMKQEQAKVDQTLKDSELEKSIKAFIIKKGQLHEELQQSLKKNTSALQQMSQNSARQTRLMELEMTIKTHLDKIVLLVQNVQQLLPR